MMDNSKEFLRKLISLPGLSGYEEPVRAAIADAWRPLTDELQTSPLGSLHALKRGACAGQRPCIMLMAHMDAVGLMVTRIIDSWLRFTEIGGVDPRILPGQRVIVHGRRQIPGIIVQPPPHLLPPEASTDKPVKMKFLYVDTGLLPEETAEVVRIGDLISFAQEPMDLSDDLLAGHSLDNRASVTALQVCLHELQQTRHDWDVWAVASVQEEENLAGARTSSFSINPDLAVAVDTTFGKSPDSQNDYRTFQLGKGITLGWGSEIHPGLYRKFKDLADQLAIPYATELMPVRSGTDGMQIVRAGMGIPTMVVSIPVRNMHTPVEVVSMQDITSAGHLLAEFITRLPMDFMQTLSLDD
jgi:putative aminopeptidase FrvX